MKNREKYRDEILNLFSGNVEEYCEFAKKDVLPNLTDCTNGTCDKVSSCLLCRSIFAFWLDEEYTEPPKPEVDWENVPVDTLVRVRNRAEDKGVLRYFKEIGDEHLNCRYFTWLGGTTSKTAEGRFMCWKYCELVEDKDDGSN